MEKAAVASSKDGTLEDDSKLKETGVPASVVFGILGNIASVVGVVITNKYIQRVHGFDSMIFLSFCHFVFTGLGIRVLLLCGAFRYKAATTRGVLPVALGSLGSVAFMNLNLAHNSVGFYQVSKLACIPVTLALNRCYSDAPIPFRVMVTLVPLVVGMAVASVHDVEATFVGTAFAAVAVLCTVASQMATASSQRALGCDSNQLLFHTSPLIALGMLALTPIFDDVNAIRHFRYTPILVRDIAASCALALAVNVTNYLVLGKTSPLTYQVVGHLKSVLTILFGFFVLGTETNARNVAGTAIAMGGLVAYTEVKRRMGLGR